jgi:hypothetical protein
MNNELTRLRKKRSSLDRAIRALEELERFASGAASQQAEGISLAHRQLFLVGNRVNDSRIEEALVDAFSLRNGRAYID